MNYIALNRSLYSKRNYVLKASVDNNYWFGISQKKLDQYINREGDDFSLIIFGSSNEGDFYIIPYSVVSPLLTESTLINSKTSRSRWVGDIKYHQLRIRNCLTRIDLSKYHGVNRSIEKMGRIEEEEENDYSINNRRIEMNARLKQSKFRNHVLRNYKYRCCVSGISNTDLLIASHIVPWATRINTRLDPANGLCLFILFDKLFDGGYMSIGQDYQVIASEELSSNKKLFDLVSTFIGKRITLPEKCKPKQEYLMYHRKNIFKR